MPFHTIIGMKWVVTVVNATERAVMERIRFQKIGERKAWRALTSGSLPALFVGCAACLSL